MAAAAEQLPRSKYVRPRPRARRFLKRQTVRLARRVSKRLLDDAPVRRYRGWAD